MRALIALFFLTLQSAVAAELTYCVLEQRDHPRENFVQGLEIVDGVLLVGTGNYGRSRLRRYDLDSMALKDEQRLHPRLFGEGITQLDGRIYQLTWRAGLGLMYSAEDLRPIGRFSIRGEGWGLTNDGEQLIYSNGSNVLQFLDPQTLDVTGSISVTRDGQPQRLLNELEWIDGKIWANVWQSDDIVIIDPASGVVESSVALAGLLPESARRADTDVLNGIAYDREREDIWVTGKHWPYLYRIKAVAATADCPDRVDGAGSGHSR